MLEWVNDGMVLTLGEAEQCAKPEALNGSVKF